MVYVTRQSARGPCPLQIVSVEAMKQTVLIGVPQIATQVIMSPHNQVDTHLQSFNMPPPLITLMCNPATAHVPTGSLASTSSSVRAETTHNSAAPAVADAAAVQKQLQPQP